MLQLLQPIALFAVAAIALPIVVHLWNVRQGKTLKIGSIQLLQASAKQHSTSWRITNWPLLLLRCLLIALVSLLLAKPYWQTNLTSTQKGWILIAAPQLKQVHAQYGSLIDSLLQAGVEMHNLSARFEKIQWADTTTASPDSFKNVAPWALLRVLDVQLPAQFPVYIFVNNRLSQYQGSRPLTHLALHWNSFGDTGTFAQTTNHAFLTADGKVRQLNLISTGSGNYYRQNEITPTGLATANTSTINTIDTNTINITIVAGANTADAQYVQAAVHAIGQYSNRKINTTLTRHDSVPAGQHLIFWLADQSPPANILPALAPAGILFRYDSGQVVKVTSWLNNQQQSLRTSQSGRLYRYTAGPVHGETLWTLANGEPLLSTEEQGGKRILHFKSRFNPQWGDLVWEEAFVKALLPYVIPSQSFVSFTDIRTVEDVQVIPQPADTGGSNSTNISLQHQATDLSSLIWIIAFLLLIAERLIAHKQKARPVNA